MCPKLDSTNTKLIVGGIALGAVIVGLIFTICWNTAMVTMFDVQKITIINAFILAFTLGCLRGGYLRGAKNQYLELKIDYMEKDKSEKVAKVLSLIISGAIYLINIIISVLVTEYTWNNIIPQLLNIDLIKINFWQAFAFGYIFHLFFGHASSSNDDKSKKKSKKKNSSFDGEIIDSEVITDE